MSKREEVFRFVRDFVTEHGYSPTLREIAKGVGLRSVDSVAYHVKFLVALGRLSQGDPRVARTLRVPSLPPPGGAQ